MVFSIEEGVRLFSSLFGFRTVETHIDSNGEFKSCILRVNEAALELLEPVGPVGPIQKFLQKRGSGLHHLSLEVDDIHKETEALRRKGARLIHTEPEVVGKSKAIFLHPHSTGGVLIELLQRIP